MMKRSRTFFASGLVVFSLFALVYPVHAQKVSTPPVGRVGKQQPSNALRQIPPGLLKKTATGSSSLFGGNAATVSGRPKMGIAALKNILASLSAQRKLATPPGLLNKLGRLSVHSATPGASLKRRAVYGVITAVQGDVLTLAHPIQRNRTVSITVNAQTVIQGRGTTLTVADLTVRTRIIAFGTRQAAGLLATRIQVIPGRATGIGSKFPSPTLGAASPTLTAVPTGSGSPSATPIVTQQAPTETPAPVVPTDTPTPTPEPSAPTPTP